VPAVLKPPPPRPPGTPDNLWLSWQTARPTPIDQADLCIPVKASRRKRPDPTHRLVVIGDSLSHGFKNYAISDTAHSWPAIVAYEMGWLDGFRRPSYDGPDGCPGLPLNLNELINSLETPGPKKPFFWNPLFVFRLRRILARVRDYWDSGPGSRQPDPGEIPHNLAIYGWDLRDALSKDYQWCQRRLAEPVSRGVLGSLFPRVSHDNERAALRVLRGDGKSSYTQLSAAKALSEQGGIETLVVGLGANNALRSIVSMKVAWSGDDFKRLETKDDYTVWRPEHFRQELRELEAKVADLKARHVIWWSVPHVTIAPLAHGVGDKPFYSRYFTRYTYVFTPDERFDANIQESLTNDEARVIDAAIDSYNRMIKSVVKRARRKGLDWYYFDICGLLDSMAYRRYLEDPRSRPKWFVPYVFPPEFANLSPIPDTRFTTSDGRGRLTGGLIGLDGVHPTTVGYGIVAREMIRVMEKAGVDFFDSAGDPRPTPVIVDWQRLFDAEPLVSHPPASLAEDLGIVGRIVDELELWRLLLR
jgi:hypothetical protein